MHEIAQKFEFSEVFKWEASRGSITAAKRYEKENKEKPKKHQKKQEA